jgi:hypothetical protein
MRKAFTLDLNSNRNNEFENYDLEEIIWSK